MTDINDPPQAVDIELKRLRSIDDRQLVMEYANCHIVNKATTSTSLIIAINQAMKERKIKVNNIYVNLAFINSDGIEDWLVLKTSIPITDTNNDKTDASYT